MITERIAPHDAEAEQALLGSILISADRLFDVQQHIQDGNDFFIIRNGWIYEAILRLQRRGDAIDYLTIVKELEAHGKLEEIGGRAYIMQLINTMPTSIHAETYAKQVAKFAYRRRILETAGRMAELAYQDDLEMDELAQQTEAAFLAATDRAEPDELERIDDVLSAHYDDQVRLRELEKSPAIPTGLKDLDAKIGGLLAGEVTVVAGRPGSGKTSLLLSAVYNIIRAGYRVAFFSLEMTKGQLASRLVSMQTGIDSQKFRLGGMSDGEWDVYVTGIDALSRQPTLYINDRGGLTPAQVRGMTRKLWMRGHTDPETGDWEPGIDMIAIDYLQLMRSPGFEGDGRVAELGRITLALKTMAKEFGVPIFTAVQVNRGPEQRQDKHPQLCDMRESGSIENDFDIVATLYRDVMYNPHTEQPDVADLTLLKNRHGTPGRIQLYFDAPHTRYKDLIIRQIDLNGPPPGSNGSVVDRFD